MNRQQRRAKAKREAKPVGSNLQSALIDAAIQHFHAGRALQAETACRVILASNPSNAATLHGLANLAHRCGRSEIAADLLHHATGIHPDNGDAYASLGGILRMIGRLDAAADACRKAIALKPDLAPAYNNLGSVLQAQRLFSDAAEMYTRAIALDPTSTEAYLNRGLLFIELGQTDLACSTFQDAIRIDPKCVDAYRHLVQTLRKEARFEEAADHLRSAATIFPEEPGYHSELAVVLMMQGKLSDAADACKRALALKPDDSATLTNLGSILHDLGRPAEAIRAYEFALKVNPVNSTALSNMGLVYRAEGQIKKAIVALRDALAIDPNCLKTMTELYQQRRSICDWDGLEQTESAVLRLRRFDERADTPPFILLATPNATAADLLHGARSWGRGYVVPEGRQLRPPTPGIVRRPGRKIRVGYLSADFYTHATALLITELLEKHDRSRFDIIGYSHSKDDRSSVRGRLVNAFDQFVDVRALSHVEAARRIYSDRIDILVDLKGYTQDARTEIVALRPAPIQVNFLGYPGTLGADFVDYIIGDPVVLPMADQPYFNEKIVQLPHCYQPNDTKRPVSEEVPTRAECGLPEGAFVFCCFNNSYKLTPALFDIWMRLLITVPNSVLWLFEANRDVRENLSREAANRGVDPARLVFAERMRFPGHLARHSHADLFLDTLPYNAHTTASDALWAGLPVLTCQGNAFAGRVAASLLRAVGLPELVTYSLQEYEDLAVRLATCPAMLADIRQRLVYNRLRTPLFDIASYSRDLERAYQHMVENWRSGRTPEAFAVADLP